MGKASEIWKEIKPKVGEMLMAVNDIETQAEKAQEEAYQSGLNDAWAAARKIALMDTETSENVTGYFGLFCIMENLTPMQAIEKIRQYEQEKEEQESITVEDVMRQYLDTFCTNETGCSVCPLHTPDFTCGRGYSFLTNNRVSDEEVRRAYAAVLAKMKEGRFE